VKNKVLLIQVLHSLVFFYMAACLIYILYAGITMTFNWILLVAVASMVTEGVVVMFNQWRCPLTLLAEKYGAKKGTITDIFFPDFIARHVFRVSFPVLIVGLIYLVFRYFAR
jgi:hypothetical protein